jgi:hypothetical protein
MKNPGGRDKALPLFAPHGKIRTRCGFYGGQSFICSYPAHCHDDPRIPDGNWIVLRTHGGRTGSMLLMWHFAKRLLIVPGVLHFFHYTVFLRRFERLE